MIPHPFKTDHLNRLSVKLVLTAVTVMALQACTATPLKPKYPIYMQDRPAEPTATIQPAPVEETPPATTTPAPSGSVKVTELAPMTPPPPPPPPPAEMTKPTQTVTTPSGAGYVYVLQSRDTLFGISRRFSVPVKSLYALNGLTADSSLRVGQKILLPVSAVDKGVEEHANGLTMTKVKTVLAATPPAKPVMTTPPPPVKPVVSAPSGTTTMTTTTTVSKPVVVAPAVAAKPVVAKPVPPVAGFPANAQIAQMGKGKFVWPVKGQVLVPFGQLAPNIRNDGINIAASSGTEVKAASEGTVVYEGDQVKELGNTI